MNDNDDDVFAFPGSRISRRTLLRGSVIAGGGLLTAALIGCGDDDDDDDDDDGGATATATSTPTAAGDDGLINADLVALNDPDQPFPWVLPEKEQEPQPGGTIVIGNNQDFAAFDPTRSTSGTVTTHLSMVNDRLLSFRDGPFLHPFKVPELEPKLARSWEESPDGLTYTFNITDKAKYHNKPPVNGRQLVAEDIKLVIERYASEGVHVANYSFVDRIEAPDDTTMVINMSSPNPDYLVILGSRYQPIYPIELVDEGLIETELVGTGPFIAEEVVKSDHVFHAKNPDYWDGPIHLDRVEFRIIPDRAAQLAGLRAGQWHHAPGAAPTFIAANALAESNPDMQIWMGDAGAPVWNLAVNLTNEKFQDERVRQALMMLLDRDLMIEVVYQGFAEHSATAPWFFAFDEKPTPDNGLLGPWWRFAPDEAKKMLQAAGAEDLEFSLIWSREEAQVEFIIESLRLGGVTVSGEQSDFTSLAAQWNNREYPEGLFGYSTGGFSADARFRGQVQFDSGINRWLINDPDLEEWSLQQATMVDPEDRREVLEKIWFRLLEKAYRIETVKPLTFHAVAPGVRNFRTQAPLSSVSGILGFGDWAPGVWLEK